MERKNLDVVPRREKRILTGLRRLFWLSIIMAAISLLTASVPALAVWGRVAVFAGSILVCVVLWSLGDFSRRYRTAAIFEGITTLLGMLQTIFQPDWAAVAEGLATLPPITFGNMKMQMMPTYAVTEGTSSTLNGVQVFVRWDFALIFMLLLVLGTLVLGLISTCFEFRGHAEVVGAEDAALGKRWRRTWRFCLWALIAGTAGLALNTLQLLLGRWGIVLMMVVMWAAVILAAFFIVNWFISFRRSIKLFSALSAEE